MACGGPPGENCGNKCGYAAYSMVVCAVECCATVYDGCVECKMKPKPEGGESRYKAHEVATRHALLAEARGYRRHGTVCRMWRCVPFRRQVQACVVRYIRGLLPAQNGVANAAVGGNGSQQVGEESKSQKPRPKRRGKSARWRRTATPC